MDISNQLKDLLKPLFQKNFKNEMKIITLSLMKGRIKDEESFVVGLDTFSPKLVERFAKEGARPNLSGSWITEVFLRLFQQFPLKPPKTGLP